jgi:hypothetical protein
MKQRQSTRQTKLSQNFKTLDEESRRELIEQRLNFLEQDNYNEKEIVGAAEDDYSDVSLMFHFFETKAPSISI